MESPLILGLTGGPRLFKEVGFNVGTNNVSRHVKIDTNEFTKSRGVIVLDSLCVAEGLQYRVGLQQLSLQLTL